MQNDEQILLNTTKFLDTLEEKCWKGYEKKGMKTMFGKRYPNCVKKTKKKKRKSRKNEELEISKEKVLREIDEDEMVALERVLDDLDPAKLPLNDLFSGKMRAVIPFPTTDPSSELGKFAEFFRSQEYEVDWEKGMVYAERDLRTAEELLDTLIGMQAGQPEKKKTKKIQMKIGKLFSKLADLSRRKDEIYQKVYKHMADINYMLPDGGGVRSPHRVTGKMLKGALDEKEYENFQRINTQIYLYIVNPGVAGPAGYNLTDLATEYGEYWKMNAGFIKKEINNIDNDKYSIIITRHPIDVLRMSDFDTITSCHSPPSRASAYQSYYKCAVAEAQGHGAVAYVVETEDLLAATDTGNIDSAEQEIQEGEIFYDDKRSFSGDIEPVSRIRVRHVRYYEGDEPPKRWDDGQDVGMPEKRVYGLDIPGLANQVTDWARSNQEEVIADMPREDGKIDLSRFMIFGGSYEDTANKEGRLALMRQLVGPDVDVEGSMRQNTETEDNLDANMVRSPVEMYRAECEEIMNEFNNKMAQTYSDYEVGEDGADSAYIKPYAAFIAKWPVDEWKRLPGNNEEVVWDSVDELNGANEHGDIFVPSKNDTPVIRRIREEIHLTIQVNFEHPEIYGGSYMAMPYEYQEALNNIDTKIDDLRDTWEAILTEYFKRNGQMEGGDYINLAMEIEDGELTSYEWDLETDGDYSESYESTARYTHYYDPEDLGLGIEVLKQIVDSRDFRIELRKQLLEAPRKAENTQYYLQMTAETLEQGVPGAREINMTVSFSINADEPDIMVGLFRELVEGEMDDEDNLKVIFNRVLAQFVNSRQPSFMQTNESIVNTWKDYLKS
jgi:hypothetical protein